MLQVSLAAARNDIPRASDSCGVKLDAIQEEKYLEALKSLPKVLLPTETQIRLLPYGAKLSKNHDLTIKDIQEIIDSKFIDLDIETYPTGVAAAGPSATYQKAWTRDLSILACALMRTGHLDLGGKLLTELGRFYAETEQRDRMASFLFSPDPIGRYTSRQDLPFIRAAIDPDHGKMVRFDTRNGIHEDTAHWPHAQLDAIGMWLFTTFRMSGQGNFDLKVLDLELDSVNPHDQTESIFIVGLKFLHKIQFWNQIDLGPWEDFERQQRATSIAQCVAAFREAKKFFETYGYNQLVSTESSDTLKAILEDGIHQGLNVLREKRITETGLAHECRNSLGHRVIDSGLILTLYPIDPGFSALEEISILNSVYQLMRPLGFIRYPEDEYVGMDYISSPKPYCMSVTDVPNYMEAQWPLFDGTLAAYYFRKYCELESPSQDLFRRGQDHLKRILAAVTPIDETVGDPTSNNTFSVKAGSLPEAYFWDSTVGRMRPNHNSPLVWTKATLALAIERFKEASLKALGNTSS
jgi:hypothetical protein